MTAEAVMMLIVSIVTVWGGLVLAIVNLARHPEEPENSGGVDVASSPADGLG